jgi:O-acetyl-ADP-ribose deacetylase (regulator of RNase III)
MKFTEGNLLEAQAEALVNTVNTVGVMGKGIALMFKEKFPENFDAYESACEAESVEVGKMFVTPGVELVGPRWIINFPTKKHWRQPSKLEWIEAGLKDLRETIQKLKIRSIAIPPLGCGDGGLDWTVVSVMIEEALGDLDDVEITVYEPTLRYQNVAKRHGVQKLTPARALIAEAIRRYWIQGIECTLLEAQKLAWFLERAIQRRALENPLDLQFNANRYGPYAFRLQHLLDKLDGSYLHCQKRLADADPFDTIWFEESKREKLDLYLQSEEARAYLPVLDDVDDLIEGFQSPLGMEALSTVDWLITKERLEPSLEGIRRGIAQWPTEPDHAKRKERLFDDQLLQLCLEQLTKSPALK